MFRQVVIIYDPKLFSKLIFRFSFINVISCILANNTIMQLSSIKKYCKIYTNVASGNVLFASARVAFLNECISPLQHWVPSSVHRGLTKAFCETILIKFTHLPKTHSERKPQRYKIYIHKGTAILLKPAMLQYSRVQSVPFMQQSSLTNVIPLPKKLFAQGVYPSILIRIMSYYFISSKAATGISKEYIKCYFLSA